MHQVANRGCSAAPRSRRPRIQRPLSRSSRVLALVLLAAAALAALTGSAGAATSLPGVPQSAPVVPGSRYLALGDSVTFGFEEAQVTPAPNYHDAASFLGYPEHLGAELHLGVTSAACPGETSSSLISATAQSNGCESTTPPTTPNVGYRTLYPLHVSYRGSQLSFAVSFLKAHPGVRLVSLMIGANDVFICQKITPDACMSPADQAPVFAKISSNVRTILSAIRNKGHYRGQLAIVNYYSLNYSSAFITNASIAINQAMDSAAKPFHVEIADGFGEFKAAALHSAGSSCTAGLLTQLGKPGSCGVHPSYAGQALLAEALEKGIRLG
jgi:lysophospholipase L1-like esterase